MAKSSKIFHTRKLTLFLISSLLVGSVILRVSDGKLRNVAFAAEEETQVSSEGPEIDNSILNSNELPLSECPNSETLAKVLEEIRKRDLLLRAEEAKLRDREASIAAAEIEIRDNLGALRKAEDELRATIALAATSAEDDLARLTAVYENMKPKEAAALFGEMTPEFAAGFLGRMRPDSAAAILAGLDSNTAYSISVVLAGRNANVPTD